MALTRESIYERLGVRPTAVARTTRLDHASEAKACALREHFEKLCRFTSARENNLRVSAFEASSSLSSGSVAEDEIRYFIAEVSTHLEVVSSNAAADRDRAYAELESAVAASASTDDDIAAAARAQRLQETLDRIDGTEARLKVALEADLVALDGALDYATEGLGLVREALQLASSDVLELHTAMQARVDSVFSALHTLWHNIASAAAVVTAGRRGAAAVRTVTDAGIVVLARTTSLCLGGSSLGEDDLRSLATLALGLTPHLQVLDLGGNGLGDGGLSALVGALPSLRCLNTLRLHAARMSSAGATILAAALPSVPLLAELRLDNNALGDIGTASIAAALPHLPQLRNLSLSATRMANDGAAALAAALERAPQLETLVLKLNSIGDAGIVALASSFPALGCLCELNLAKNVFSDPAKVAIFISALSSLSTLQTLSVGHASFPLALASNLVQALPRMPKLASLSLNEVVFNKNSYSVLAETLRELKQLISLELAGCGLGDDGVIAIEPALHSLTSLRSLNLQGNVIDDRGAVALASAIGFAQYLTHLTLSSNRIGDVGASALASALSRLPLLTTLRLGGNRINTRGLGDLLAASAATRYLAVVELQGSNTGRADGLLRTPPLALLTTLRLGNSRIGLEGAHALSEALRHTPLLSDLSLCENSLCTEGAIALAAALPKVPRLNSLNVEGNAILSAGVKALAGAFAAGAVPLLTLLELGNNTMGDAGLIDLSASLPALPLLRFLGLGHNRIDHNTGAAAFAAAVQDGAIPLLETLDFRRNPVCGCGPEQPGLALAEACVKLPLLSSLNLSSTGCGDAFVRALVPGLPRLRLLESLNLGSNALTPVAARDLAEWLAAPGSAPLLVSLGLRGNGLLRDEGVAIISAVFPRSGGLGAQLVLD